MVIKKFIILIVTLVLGKKCKCYLSPSFSCMVWHHNIRPDLNLVPVDDEGAPGLHGQLARARRPRAEAHDLDVAGVRWLEFNYVVSLIKFFLVYHTVELNSFISNKIMF